MNPTSAIALVVLVLLAVAGVVIGHIGLPSQPATVLPAPKHTLELAPPPVCEPERAPCEARHKAKRIALRFLEPAQALEPFAVEVALASAKPDGTPAVLPIAGVVIELDMVRMDMGYHRHRLDRVAEGVYRGELLLPVCQSGRLDWYAQIEAQVGNERWQTRFDFEIDPPA